MTELVHLSTVDGRGTECGIQHPTLADNRARRDEQQSEATYYPSHVTCPVCLTWIEKRNNNEQG